MGSYAGKREVHFSIQPQQQYAAHLRLTPQLLEALLRGQEHAEPISLQFGANAASNAITVGDAHFGFIALPETGTCDLLRIGSGGGEDACVVAQVKQKIQVQRNLRDEKERVRARAEEAERERRERKTVVLSDKPVPGKGGPKTERHVRSVTPPPRGLTPPPRPVVKAALTQSMLAPAQQQPRPPLPPSAVAGGVAAVPQLNRRTPPPGAGAVAAAGAAASVAAGGGAGASGAPLGAAGKGPMKKSASTGRLGLVGGKGPSNSGSTAPSGAAGTARASAAVVAAARRGGADNGVGYALLVLLAERPVTMQGARSVLTDVASKVKGFQVPDREKLERALKKVSDYCTPGKYFLKEWLRKEAEGIGAVTREESPPSSDERAPEPAAAAAAGKKREQGQPKVAAKERQGGGCGKRSREPSPPGGESSPGGRAGRGQQQQQQPGKAQKTAHRASAGGSAAAAAAAVEGGSGTPPPPARHWRSASQPPPGTSAAAGAAVAGAVPALATVPPPAATPPMTSPASLAETPPSLGTTATTNSGGVASEGAPRAVATGRVARAGRAGKAGAGGQSSSSRGSQEYDDSWIERHAGRQPEAAGPISSKEEYRQREAAFNSKYETYFRLHQLIEANKRDFAALNDALVGPGTPEERQRLQAEIDKLWRKRGERAKRWDAAFRVLHSELAATKARMAEFVAAFQQAQQQEQQGGQQQARQQRAKAAVQVQ